VGVLAAAQRNVERGERLAILRALQDEPFAARRAGVVNAA
jgi:putative ubiquitin-RnfH superfamily antitoxin RatB of RatAB toxin-antitoxin module